MNFCHHGRRGREHPGGVVGGDRGIQILIADRDQELAELIAYTLRRAGLRVLAAYDEATALELFASQRPCVVVLDTTGLDLLQPFRAGSRNGAIIVATARGTKDAPVNAMEQGPDHYLTKPFCPR